MSGYGNHPYANLFPYAREEDFAALCQDIMLNGLIEPIVLYNGDVLDGRNRYRACINTRVQPRFTEFHGDDAAALRFVISKNLARRHLDASQRAMAAARIANIKHGGDRRSDDFKGPDGTLNIPEAAEKLNVGERSVKRARKVLASDDAELISAVDAGEVTVSAAAEYLETPEAERTDVKTLIERPKVKSNRANDTPPSLPAIANSIATGLQANIAESIKAGIDAIKSEPTEKSHNELSATFTLTMTEPRAHELHDHYEQQAGYSRSSAKPEKRRNLLKRPLTDDEQARAAYYISQAECFDNLALQIEERAKALGWLCWCDKESEWVWLSDRN
jgi:hypothetical protein